MKSSVSTLGVHDTLRDFTADRRLLVLSAMALVTGSFGAAAAWALLKLIALVTNIAYFQTLSTATSYLSHARLGPASIAIPVVGGLIVGLMARYGSEKIRGHGIPEALEAILIGQSRIQPKVALLKPLSSAIAIGTGGPFGAEGPIIMTGGALGSLFAQFFHLSSAERKTLLVAGAAAGMTAHLRHAGGGGPARHRGDALRVEAAQLRARGRLLGGRHGLAAVAGGRVAALSACGDPRDAVVGTGALRRDRRACGIAVGHYHRRPLLGRGPVREAADPLDVVAGARRRRRRNRRTDRPRRPGCRLRQHRRADQRHGADPRGRGAAARQGRHLGRGARLRDFRAARWRRC